MPKDYTTLSSEITDPAIKRELQQEADLRKAELALSRLDSELAAGGEALKKMPAIEGELAALRKMLDRPLSVQATLAQPVAEASIKRPDILGSLRTAVTAEFIRRVNRTDPEKTIAELLPDDANRLRRKHARHMLGRKSGTETGSTASPLWGREITQREVLDYWAALEPVSIAGALIARGYAQPLTFGPNVALTIPLRDPANRGSMRPAWGSEGSTIPVVRGGLTSKTFNRHRLDAISVFSQELAKVATPSIAALIQSFILEDMAAAIDAELFGEFDAIAGVRPASLNTGVTHHHDHERSVAGHRGPAECCDRQQATSSCAHPRHRGCHEAPGASG